jgi:hypothetical protein
MDKDYELLLWMIDTGLAEKLKIFGWNSRAPQILKD